MRKFLTGLFMAAGVSLAVFAVASEAPAAAQPAAAAADPAQALLARVNIPFETFTLDNGLRVIVHEDRKAPVVRCPSGTMSAPRTNRPAAPASPICSST